MAEIKKVLIADDVSMHRNLIKSTIRQVGAELGIQFELIGEGENGIQLVELFSKAPKGSIDIVFSDIRMPDMDGLSALVKILQLHPTQKVIMASSEDLQKMEAANILHEETKRKTLELRQRLDLLKKVRDRIHNNQTEEGKTNSILIGCEKLALDPIWVAEQFGAMGYLRKPYDHAKSKEVISFVLNSPPGKFLAKA
jgi:two-component system response regulator YesN